MRAFTDRLRGWMESAFVHVFLAFSTSRTFLAPFISLSITPLPESLTARRLASILSCLSLVCVFLSLGARQLCDPRARGKVECVLFLLRHAARQLSAPLLSQRRLYAFPRWRTATCATCIAEKLCSSFKPVNIKYEKSWISASLPGSLTFLPVPLTLYVLP